MDIMDCVRNLEESFTTVEESSLNQKPKREKRE